MRNRFEQQLSIGQRPIEETVIRAKSKNAVDELLAALKSIYCNREYNEKIFKMLENHLRADKKNTGRKGMDLWCIFVLAQLRLCLNISYEMLHNLANNHRTLRHLMGIEHDFGYERIEFEYQNIYDNVSMLNDELIVEINQVVLEFGHYKVFKKKENSALRLKTDSFVVESNVHFPTDYNLLWDSAKKCLDTVSKFLEKYQELEGWRKIGNWHYELKGLMRELGKASSSGGKGKQDRIIAATKRYLTKANALLNKLNDVLPALPQNDTKDVLLILVLEHFMVLMEKHIDLLKRRVLQGEKIPHKEKLFSIFETYTEWVKKGKTRPNVELGKKLTITTDQYNLIVDYQLMHNEQDRDIVIELADRMLNRYNIASWSFDKGYWRKQNKELLQLMVPKVVMPKLGRKNKAEEQEESGRSFKRLKNHHSAIESNINELEHRGLDRCPDRGVLHYKRYISLGVCTYNLKKIGREILRQQHEIELKEMEQYKSVA
ncbi:MAG: ISNCY family transposase [Candidatus Aenigmarchaeota archaeon]|nr:ISNCY family transposase [Candidatus Aenigmarchaeota archaeon]